MGKRGDPLDEAILWLYKVHNDETIDVLQKQTALELALKLETFSFEFKSLTGKAKRMGRHARAEEAAASLASDLDCYKRVEALVADEHLPWVNAYEKVGEQVNKSGEAVKKARERAKRRLSSFGRTFLLPRKT